MSTSTRWLARITASLAALAVLGSCVSDRTTGPRTDANGCNVQLPSEAFGSTIVIIRDFAFSPAQVHVAPGSKVTWVNCGAPADPAHTSTSDTGVWGSPLLSPGGTYTQAFPTAGTFPYHCVPHPGMTASVVVQ